MTLNRKSQTSSWQGRELLSTGLSVRPVSAMTPELAHQYFNIDTIWEGLE